MVSVEKSYLRTGDGAFTVFALGVNCGVGVGRAQLGGADNVARGGFLSLRLRPRCGHQLEEREREKKGGREERNHTGVRFEERV